MPAQLDIPAFLASLILLGALLGSAALWFARLRMSRSSIQQNIPVPPWSIGWANFGIFICALVIAVYIVQGGAMQLLADHIPTTESGEPKLTPWVAILSIILLQAPLLAVFYTARRHFPHQFAGQLNSTHLSLREALFRAAPTFLRFLPIILSTNVAWSGLLVILQKFEWIGETPPQELIELFAAGGNPLAIGILVLLAVVGAPIAEEIIFRGCLYRFLKSKTMIPFAQFFSGILFALMHGNVMSLGPLLIVGIMLAHVYETEGNLKVAICFHALFNSFSLLMLLLISYSSVIPAQ